MKPHQTTPDSLTFSARPRILIPRPLEPGDPVGIIASSGPVVLDLLEAGVRFLESLGFKVRMGCHVYECAGYLAGTDEQRCCDLNDMLADPGIRGIFFARGGYGIMRLLDTLDHEAIRRDPKILVGMSDVTALSLSLFTHCGLVTLAGPMIAGQVGSGLDDLSREQLVRAVTQPLPGQDLLLSGHPVRVLKRGRAEGRLVGGCLSLLTALLGTRHAPDFSGAILILEEVNEPPYRIDRMLTHLKLAGVLDRVAGIVMGHFSAQDKTDLSRDAEEILSGLTQDLSIPVLAGFPHGHVLPNLTIPHGATVELSTDPPCLSVSDVGNDSLN